MFGLSSTLSFAIWMRPACSLAMSSSTGAIILHGPHHSAQKSTNTGASAPPTPSSNVASVKVTIPSATVGPLVGNSTLLGGFLGTGPGIAERFEVLLGFERCHAARSGGGDGLAERAVLHVAGRVHA